MKQNLSYDKYIKSNTLNSLMRYEIDICQNVD